MSSAFSIRYTDYSFNRQSVHLSICSSRGRSRYIDISMTYRKISNISPGLIFDFGTFFWAYIRGGLYSRGTIFEGFFLHGIYFVVWNLFPEFIYFLAHSCHFLSTNMLILNFLVHKFHKFSKICLIHFKMNL